METFTPVPYFTGLALGTVLGGFFGSSIVLDNYKGTPERIEHVQQYNEQLHEQLAVGQKVVAHLIVDDNKKTYRFDTVINQHNETCTGSYALQNDKAVATGKLACVSVVDLQK
jgi:hypothetical protein